MLETLRRVSQSQPLLVVLHNQRQARQIASTMLLLAGGRIQAQCSKDEFFDRPRLRGRGDFVRTGLRRRPSPDAKREHLADHVTPPPALPLAAQLAVTATAEYRTIRVPMGHPGQWSQARRCPVSFKALIRTSRLAHGRCHNVDHPDRTRHRSRRLAPPWPAQPAPADPRPRAPHRSLIRC